MDQTLGSNSYLVKFSSTSHTNLNGTQPCIALRAEAILVSFGRIDKRRDVIVEATASERVTLLNRGSGLKLSFDVSIVSQSLTN